MKQLFCKLTALYTIFLFSVAICSGLDQNFNPDRIRSYFCTHYEQTERMVNLSSEKDIVVFFGKTGAGKTTLINYLLGKSLIHTGRGRLDLDASETQGFNIGHGNSSCTSEPSCVKCGGLWYWDFPGFGDTGGPIVDSFNALIMKRVVENAKIVRFALVTNLGEIETGRGQGFEEYVNQISRLIPPTLIRETLISMTSLSSLVVTKVNKDYCPDLAIFKEELAEKASQATVIWREEKSQPMYAPQLIGRYNEPDQRAAIIALIEGTRSAKIPRVDIEHVFSERIRNQLSAIFETEILEIAQRLIRQSANLSSLSKQELKDERSFYEEDFIQEVRNVFGKSSIVHLLREIAGDRYAETARNIPRYCSLLKSQMLSEIERTISEKRKDECIKELKKARRHLEDRKEDLKEERDELRAINEKLEKKFAELEKK